MFLPHILFTCSVVHPSAPPTLPPSLLTFFLFPLQFNSRVGLGWVFPFSFPFPFYFFLFLNTILVSVVSITPLTDPFFPFKSIHYQYHHPRRLFQFLVCKFFLSLSLISSKIPKVFIGFFFCSFNYGTKCLFDRL